MSGGGQSGRQPCLAERNRGSIVVSDQKPGSRVSERALHRFFNADFADDHVVVEAPWLRHKLRPQVSGLAAGSRSERYDFAGAVEHDNLLSLQGWRPHSAKKVMVGDQRELGCVPYRLL